MKKIIVITGTPGVGKTTVSKLLAKKLGAKLYDSTSIVNKYKLYSGKDKFGSKIVDLGQLSTKVKKIIASEKSGLLIFEGHLLCEMKIKGATVIVLREHLRTLIKRLQQRGYPTEKTRDNLVSEATDYCGQISRKNYEKVFEIMGGKGSFEKMQSIINGKVQKQKAIELLEELVPILRKNKKLVL